MINKKIIPKLKSACVALGLMKPGQSNPVVIGGSGFIVDPEGFVITADHVTIELEKEKQKRKNNGEKLEIAAFWFKEGDDISGDFLTIPIKEGRGIKIDIPQLDDFIPKEHDIAVCRLVGKFKKLPTLKFMKPKKLDVFEEILMCGYPGGYGSLRPEDNWYGKRFSPVVQTGHIASVMPADKTLNPIGIQTDIIGTGGSSGSPIVDGKSGKVLAVAQRGITQPVVDENKIPIGSLGMGLIWGVSNYFIYDAIPKMITSLKQRLNQEGLPLPGMNGPDDIVINDMFYLPDN